MSKGKLLRIKHVVHGYAAVTYRKLDDIKTFREGLRGVERVLLVEYENGKTEIFHGFQSSECVWPGMEAASEGGAS